VIGWGLNADGHSLVPDDAKSAITDIEMNETSTIVNSYIENNSDIDISVPTCTWLVKKTGKSRHLY
jgi:hypothetical protein